VSERVRFTGRVSEGELAKLYRSALCLCFISHYEGFGLPIIEAFASGTPVITSNVTSMPEIAGDAALLVNPNNIVEISDALLKISQDNALRAKLIKRGYERAAYFNWDIVAERVLAAIETINDGVSHQIEWS
jgi:glycosyltransferase involved in cell wall biosynthesis